MKFITKRMFWLIKETKEDVKGKETVTTKAVDINDDMVKLKTAIKIHGGFENIKIDLEAAEKPTTVKFT
jgi:heterodisulfide reductase subunit A-like polyferredoxin